MAKRYLGVCLRCWKHPQHESALLCETCFLIVTHEPPPLPREAVREWCEDLPLCHYCGVSGDAHTIECLKRPPRLPKRKPVPVPQVPAELAPAQEVRDEWLAKLEAQAFPQVRMNRAVKKFFAQGVIGAALIGVIYIGAVVVPRHIPDSPRKPGNHQPVKELKLEDMTAVDLTQR